MLPRLTPAGVIQPDVKISAQELPSGLKVGGFFDVLIGEIFSPGLFYVQVIQQQSYDLDDLVDEMADMYGSVVEPALQVSWEDLRVGLHCAARVEGEDKWYRVVVNSVNSITSVQVNLLDFGGTFSVPLSSLAWLLTQFCPLPAQALLAKLANVAPPHGCSSWPQASGARLLDLCRPACERWEGNRGLVARLEEWGQGGKVELSLFDTVTNIEPKGVDIRKMLVEEGLARMVTKLPDDIKYLEEMLPNRRSYKYPPLRCPDFLCADISDEERYQTNQSSEQSEDTSIKTQLKSLLNLQNKVHSLVRKNVVTEEEEGIFCQMSELQSQYQALLARLLSRMGGATGQGRGEDCRLSEERQKFQTESWEEVSNQHQHLQAGVSESGEIPTVSKLSLSTGHTLHPVIWQGDCWITSAEVSSLNPDWHGYDLLSMLHRKKLEGEVQSLQISADTEEYLFQEMILEGVGGLLNKKSGKTIMRVVHINIGHEDLAKIEMFVSRH